MHWHILLKPANAATYDNLSYNANLTLTSNNSLLERSGSVHPTIPQKRLKFAPAETFRGGLGLKTTWQVVVAYLN